MIWFLLFIQEPTDLADLAWLSGCWRLDTKSGYVEETWSRHEGGVLLGMSRRLKDGQVTGTEFLRIEKQAGTWVYVADPSGQTKTVFSLVEHAPGRWVFENKDHDFPQRIIYARSEDGHLHASIEGPKGSEWISIPFHYQRVSCP